RDVVNHLVGMDLVFAALIEDGPMPERGADLLGDDPVGACRASGASLQAAFSRPGVLERSYRGPLGSATGAERLPWTPRCPLISLSPHPVIVLASGTELSVPQVSAWL
ncbi:hypothetical protein GA0115254_10145, partial [Streptomyces sp. Ncost-T10-10d]